MNHRFVASFSLLFLAACAVPTAKPGALPHVIDSEWTTSTRARPASFPAVPVALPSVDAEERAATPKVLAGGDSYTLGKIGVFVPEGDLSDLDEGVAFELAFGKKLLPILSIEGSLGYIGTEGRVGSVDVNVDSIPLFVNGRVNLPILVFELYGGIGIGGIYTDYSLQGFDDNDFVAATQAFLGVEFGIGGVGVGAEYKYLASDETKDEFRIEGGVASLFVTMPF
ncbi:MAG TPA: outer membrane beta-barrel protein [Planctomycetota bacterium]|nr:outer membrane beta-barrel protein [Planctomycetota bacterium]